MKNNPSIHYPISTILLVLALAYCLSPIASLGQYRFNQYTAPIATNAFVSTNTYSTSGSTTFDVGSGTTAWIQLSFKMATNDYPHFATNDVVTVWQSSLDGTRFTNQFLFAVKSKVTATNTEVWDFTNFPVTLPWLKYVGLTNLNQARLTNYSIRVANKVGL